MFTYAPTVAAQSSLAASEIVKRSENAQDAYAFLKSGDDAYRSADYSTAVQKYAEAISNLPMNAVATRGLRVSAVQRFSQASLVRAQELQRSGKYDEIQVLLDEVDKVDPDNFGVSQFRKKMDDPIRTNPSLTAEHTRNVDKVRRLLNEAQGYYDLGLYDRAEMTYEDVLRIDKFNKAARRGMERVSHAISEYGTAARDQARSEALRDVDAAWGDRAHLNLEVPLINEQTEGVEGLQNETLVGKLNTIMVPSVDLQDANLDEALDFLRIASRANDMGSADQSAKGLDFILQLGSPDNPKVQAVNQARINVYLRNVPLQQALKVITEATGTQYRIDEFAVVIYPTGAADPTLIRRDFRVPANFLSSSALNGTGGGSDDPFATPEAGSGSLIAKRLNATEKLKSLGLPFPEGATASFNGGVLSVRNTAENLEYVAEIVNIVASQEPIGVVIKTTVIDISQTDFEELGFDSIINEVNVGSNYKLSGGTTGSGTAITDMIGGNPTSSGLRIGELTGGTDSLDAIINRKAPPTASGAFSSSGGAGSSSVTAPTGGGGGTTRSPGVLSFRALIDENVHELLMRGFDQKKGADIMVRPEVITRSGQNAEIASIQEFTYPTEFEPPEIPNSVGSGQSVVTPATPTSFEVKNLGVMLEVLPEVSADRQFIEVAVKPTIREFEGFVNYGTPIVGSSTSTSFDIAEGLLSQSGNVGVLTTNDILVPVFKEVTTNTNVVVQNGHTIVIGGLLTESRKKVEDKLPILGDIPWFGRFFQANALESESRHVIIMLNVELVDAAGEPYRNR